MQSLRSRAVARSVVATAVLVTVFAFPTSAAAVRVLAEDTLENAVAAKINGVRKAHGLRPLAVRASLERAAASHATNMARYGYFSHSWSTGAPFGRWIQRYWPGPGYGAWSAGENLYWRTPGATAAHVIAAWLNSPSHRANLLGRKWRAVGIGAVQALDPIGPYAGGPAATIVAAEFGRRS
jgi:uncharacterized protein YkwD